MKILGISGSLKQASLNTRLLENAAQMLPDGTTLAIQRLDDIVFYNEDLDLPEKPETVRRLIQNIEEADALLFASPEYNHSIPGVLKNAIDWASRPAFASPLKNKPCGILTASTSPVGGARAQADLKNVLSSTLSPVYPAIEYLLPMAADKFDDPGVLIDETARRRLQRYLNGFIQWASQLDQASFSA